jgi:putative membrane protein
MDMVWFGGVWFFLALLMQLAVLVLVVLGIVWLVRRLSAGGPGTASGADPARSARDELEMRYARGEIDRPTYLQMRDDLGMGGSG